jgi:hypothetical protein
VDWIHVSQDRPGAGSYKHGNETPDSIKDGKVLDQICDYQLL